MADAAAPSGARHSRFWLYAPIALLALVAVLWSAAWFVIRDRTGKALDAWIASERQAGRAWDCQDRTVRGYPFRVEVTCAAVTLQRGDVKASLGRVQSVAQVYQPRHVITAIGGPLRLSDGRINLEAQWRLLETSIRGSAKGLQRASLVAEAPSVRVSGEGMSETALSSQRLDAHLRPSPGSGEDGSYDVALNALQARIPALDALLGGAEPANLQLDVTATRAHGVRGRPIAEEVERWREADGRLKVLLLSLAKGPRRLEARGELRLDEMRRPAGELAVAAAGIEGLIGAATGSRLGGSLFGGPSGPAPPPSAPAGQNLVPLPPLRLENGRLALGPFVLPNVRLPPLY